MTYVESYFVSVHPDQRKSYDTFSAKIATVFRQHGALRIIDRWMDEAPQASGTFPPEVVRAALDKTSKAFCDSRTMAGAGPDEIVMLSWIEWPDKAARDAGLARALAELRLQLSDDDELIFEGRRQISGNFMMILDTERS